MADIGAIGFMNGYDFKQVLVGTNIYLADGNRLLQARNSINFKYLTDYYNTTTISGTVKDASENPLENYPVGLFYRPNMKLISKTLSAADGTFSFEHILGASDDYFCTCLDPTKTLNGLIFDTITPE